MRRRRRRLRGRGRRARDGDGSRPRPPAVARAAGDRLDLRGPRSRARSRRRPPIRASRRRASASSRAITAVPAGDDRRLPEPRRHLPQRVQPVAGREVRPRPLPQRRLARDDVRQPRARPRLLQHPPADGRVSHRDRRNDLGADGRGRKAPSSRACPPGARRRPRVGREGRRLSGHGRRGRGKAGLRSRSRSTARAGARRRTRTSTERNILLRTTMRTGTDAPRSTSGEATRVTPLETQATPCRLRLAPSRRAAAARARAGARDEVLRRGRPPRPPDARRRRSRSRRGARTRSAEKSIRESLSALPGDLSRLPGEPRGRASPAGHERGGRARHEGALRREGRRRRSTTGRRQGAASSTRGRSFSSTRTASSSTGATRTIDRREPAVLREGEVGRGRAPRHARDGRHPRRRGSRRVASVPVLAGDMSRRRRAPRAASSPSPSPLDESAREDAAGITNGQTGFVANTARRGEPPRVELSAATEGFRGDLLVPGARGATAPPWTRSSRRDRRSGRSTSSWRATAASSRPCRSRARRTRRSEPSSSRARATRRRPRSGGSATRSSGWAPSRSSSRSRSPSPWAGASRVRSTSSRAARPRSAKEIST